MVEATEIDEIPDAPAKSGGKGMLFGAIAALALGGGGFFVTYTGIFPPAAEPDAPAPPAEIPPLGDVAFVPLDQMIVSLGPRANARHLQITVQLEVAPEAAEDVRALLPRVLDVINTYLRALEERDLEDPAAMTRLRAQMLRRVQIVTGAGRVRDLLVTEFVLN